MDIKETLTIWHGGDTETHLVQIHKARSEDKDVLFRQMYALRRSARYDSQRHYNFEDPILDEEYLKWKDRHETIGMYYGDSPVD